MKKVIATSLAFAVLLGLSSCGDSTNDVHERIQRASMEAERARLSTVPTTKSNKDKITIDPFENVSYTISETEGWNKNRYPSDFEIVFEASESPVGKVAEYTFFIESADDKQIVIRSRANIDDDVQEYLDENSFKIENNEKTFIIDVANLETDLLSTDSIDQSAKEKLRSDIIELLESELKMSEDEEFYYAPDAFGIMQNNPDYIAEKKEAQEEFEKKKEESLKLKFKVEKIYAIMPKTIDYNLLTQKDESSIHHYSDTTSFEDVEIYTNEAALEITSSNSDNNCCFAIASDNNGNFYCINCGSFVIKNGKLQDPTLKLTANLLAIGADIDYRFESEKDAYDKGLNSYMTKPSDYGVFEIK